MVDVRTNLLKNRRTLSEKDYQKERSLLQKSVVGIVVAAVIVVSLSVWNLFLANKLSGIETAVTAASKELQGLSQASAQQIYLKSRLNLVTGFLGERTDARESLQKILAINVGGSHLSGLSFENESMLGVEYVSTNITALNDLLKYYQSDTGYFTQVVSRGINRSQDGSYKLTMSLSLPKENK